MIEIEIGVNLLRATWILAIALVFWAIFRGGSVLFKKE